jgi:myo-inositol-1-phosphate synthase
MSLHVPNRRIPIAIAGVGNCASSLVQGIEFYRSRPDAVGLAHVDFGGYRVGDIEVVAAFDIDARKVGKPLHDALLAPPNNTTIFQPLPAGVGPVVRVGPTLDGVAAHMSQYPATMRFEPTSDRACDVADVLRSSGAQMLISYLPVGSDEATAHYAQACLDAGVALVNCVPSFVASDPGWAARFRAAGIPCVGDDIKAQLGATITHRTLARLLADRGMSIRNTYQLNTGGNSDFLNMLARERLDSKKISKTNAVQSQLDVPLPPDQIHVGPSDFIPFLRDNKVCFLRIEADGFGGVPMHLELRLSVEDSPNSAGVVVDAIRGCRVALDRRLAGPIDVVSAWTMKHPPTQMRDDLALNELHRWLKEPQ